MNLCTIAHLLNETIVSTRIDAMSRNHVFLPIIPHLLVDDKVRTEAHTQRYTKIFTYISIPVYINSLKLYRYHSACTFSLYSTKKVFKTYKYFLFSLVIKGYKKDLEENELWELPPQDQTTTQVPKFEKMWKEEQRRCALINR